MKRTKTETVASAIAQLISDGTFSGLLPTREKLMQMFDVSDGTIRNATRILVAEGFVSQVNENSPKAGYKVTRR